MTMVFSLFLFVAAAAAVVDFIVNVIRYESNNNKVIWPTTSSRYLALRQKETAGYSNDVDRRPQRAKKHEPPTFILSLLFHLLLPLENCLFIYIDWIIRVSTAGPSYIELLFILHSHDTMWRGYTVHRCPYHPNYLLSCLFFCRPATDIIRLLETGATYVRLPFSQHKMVPRRWVARTFFFSCCGRTDEWRPVWCATCDIVHSGSGYWLINCKFLFLLSRFSYFVSSRLCVCRICRTYISIERQT